MSQSDGFPETRLESEDELRAVHKGPASRPPAKAKPVPPKRTAAAAKSLPFRPILRAPMAWLTVYDDGKTEGRVIRILASRFVIGRTEGDLVIPHDELISTRHVEITRLQVGAVWRWTLTNLQSTNGLFVRVSRTGLADRSEILVGAGRYRFDASSNSADGTVDHLPSDPANFGSTKGWGDVVAPTLPPALTELIGGTIGNRILLTQSEYWIGTDPSCAICRPTDPFCEPRQARVFRDAKGWHAEHLKTQNGLWNRVSQIAVDKAVQFQIGEQRFRLEV